MCKGTIFTTTQRRFTRVALLLLFALLLAPGVGWGQTLSQYTFSASSGTFSALGTGSTQLAGGDEKVFNSIPIGFTFKYCGIDYTTVSASSNGWLTLGQNISDATYDNRLSNGGTQPVIAPLWDDLTTTYVLYQTTGTAPNRVFTIEWRGIYWNYNASNTSFDLQVKIYEETNVVEFRYNRINNTFNSRSASIGITDKGTDANNFMSLSDGTNDATVSLSSETTNIKDRIADNQKYTFTPPAIYYSQGGSASQLSQWNTSKTGGGSTPTSFTASNQIFVVQQNSTMTANAAWGISGVNTKLQVEDGATLTANAPITLSAATTFQLDAGATYNHNVASDAIWLGTEVIDAASTVVYGASGAQNVAALSYGNLTIAGGGAKTLQGDVAVKGNLDLQQGSLAIGANILNLSGTATRTGAADGTLIGGATSNLSITGSGDLGTLYFAGGAQTLNNLTLNRTALGTATLGSPLTIGGTLALTSGKLVLGANDLTLGAAASVVGIFSGTSMVDVGGGGGVVKQGNASPDFVMTYPIGVGADYTPMQLGSLSATTVAPGSWVRVASSATPAPGVTGNTPLNRYWTTSTSGFGGSVLADVQFTYLSGDVPAGTAGTHDMVYKPTSGSWAFPGGVGATGVNPLRASAATTLDAVWTATVPDKKIFYSLKSGSWDEPATWTLDPSGTQPLNPNNLTPTTSLTAAFDEVVVLSGRTVTVPTNGKTNKRINVIGTLDFGLTTGHSFTLIEGTGRIRLAGDNFPAGDATDFITAGQGQGTVEYYGDNRSITTPRTFYSVEVNMDAGKVLTLLANHTLNGNLTVANGTLSISDAAATTALDITVKGDVVVAALGKIATGNANARHQLNLYGNFTNSGEVRFTNRTAASYIAEATDGIVDVNFLNTAASQSVLCKGLTNFYRIEVDKGTDNTFTLNLDATAPANFNLFGYANEDHVPVAQLTANNNALGLIRGTVRIGNSIVIPTLSTADRYNISEAAQLWVNGGTVQKNSGQTIAVYGKLKATTGLLEAKIQNGITLCNNGSLNVDGGTVNVNQLRTSDETGGPHNGAYVQSGGTVNVLGGTVNTDHYVFSLTSAASVFNMSGGTLKVNTAAGNGAILINSDPENVKVVGGTVVGETTAADNFRITSRAPFWNLEMKSAAAGSGSFTLSAANSIGASNVNVGVQPLRVLNDLKLWGTADVTSKAITFDPSTNDVYIGGSFIVEKGATYKPISGGTAPYDTPTNQPTLRNTTYFNKTVGTGAVEELYWGETSSPLELGNIVVDRTNGYEVKVTSGSGRANESVAVDVNGKASVLSGTLNQNLYTIRTWGAIENKGRMGTWYPGVTPSRAQIKLMDNPSLTLTTSSDAVFGNIQVNVPSTSMLSLTSDTYVERMEYVQGLIYLKGYNLKVDYMWNFNTGLFENSTVNSYLSVANSGASGSSMIITDGKASDGGLSLKVTANSLAENQNNIINNFGPLTYPVGFTTDGGTTLYFRPVQMMVKGYADDGYVTIRPVFGSLQTTNQTGGEVLQHYWRVSHSGFATKPTVSYRFYYRNKKGVANVDLASSAANEATYVPGKVLDESPYTRLYETSDDIYKAFGGNNSRFITINGTSTGALFTPSAAGITLENANYTAGVQNRFTGSVLIYYTRDHGINDNNGTQHIGNREPLWTDRNTWACSNNLDPSFSPHDSRQPAAASAPGPADVAVIGWVPWTDIFKDGNPSNGGTATDNIDLRGQPHGVWIDNNTQQVAEVVFTKMTDAGGNPVPRKIRSNFQFRPTLCINGTNGQLRAKMVKGEGMFWNRYSDPDYTQMDIGDFARQDSSYVVYENSTDGRTINNTAPLFPNLCISNDNWGANDKDLTFSRNIETTGNFELLGNMNLVLPTGSTGNIVVGRDLKLFEIPNPPQGSPSGGGAEIAYQNTGTRRKIAVKGDLLMVNGGSVIHVRSANGVPIDHELHVEGDIVQGTSALSSTGLDLWSGANNDRITLYLDGPNSMTYNRVTGTVPDLYRLVVSKGNSQSTTAQFNTDYNLNGPTSGVGVAKALELRNGTFISNPTAGHTLNLTTGNDYFDIPATAGLEIKRGTARAIGNSGISLDGTLTISGGTLDMVTGGGENSIEYSASGNATIDISSGSLNVGGQIRRSLTSDAGILKYKQAGGSVVVGQNAATANSRGVFEILNAGSSFTMTAGDLYIARAQVSPEIAAFYFNPTTYSIGGGANINIGHSTTPAGQTIGIYAGKPFPSIRVNNQSGNKPTAQLQVVPATISSLLTVDAGATFDANGLGLTLNGNMSCQGTFIPKGNTTYFSGAGTQTISSGGSAINFYNLDKTSSSNVTLAVNTPLLVSNELLLRAGTFTTNANTVEAKGNVLNDALHVSSLGATNGIILNGTVNQILTGSGTFGKLTINNPSGVDIPVGNQLKITNSLKMQAGVLNIGKNLLDLLSGAVIEQGSAFSKSNMITTNISFTDNGVRKFFPSGAQSIFTFPVGSADKYTPVAIKVDANTSGTGSITVKPANEVHPSIVEDSETGTQIVDKDNALQYYWTLKADNLSGFNGTAKMNYIGTDVKVTTPYTVADYITARLLSDGSGNWNKFSTSDFDEAAKEMNYFFNNTDAAGVSGDYTAGACDATKNGAIPDKVAKYETIANGDWTTATVWTPNVAGGPHGAIAKINGPHTVDVTTNNLAGYMTEVYGKLMLYSTYGHRLGIVNGNGTIYSEIGEIPAAVYDDFFSSAGGTLEFGGANKSYEFLGNIFEVNHLLFTGSGVRRFPNNNLTLNGNLIINGDSGLDLVNYYNRTVSVKGNIERVGGTFDAGSGVNATVAMVGSLLQTIKGAFVDGNALNNLVVNNLNGVSVVNDIEIDGDLKLTGGLITVPAGTLFKLNYGATASPSAGIPLSFVNGELTKAMMTGNNFTFPIGNFSDTKAHGPISLLNVSGPAGITDWSASYSYADATNVGLPTDSFEAPISTVSHSEYWKIQAPTGGQSQISIALDGSSDVASTIPDMSNLRVVGWNATTSKWEVVGDGAAVSGSSTNGTVTTTSSVSFGSYTHFTLGSVMPLSASSASFTSPGTVNLCSGSSTTMTVTFSGTPPWVLTYKAGATTITTPPLATSPYSITVTPAASTTYTLTGITANGIAGTITGTTSVVVNVNPMPTVVVSSNDADNTICEGSSITFTATSGLTNYTFRVNGAVVQNGGSNTYTPPTTLLPAGTQSVDVIATNSGGCSSTSSAVVVTVNPKPAAAGLIGGDVSVCKNTTVVYTVPAIDNASSYEWKVNGVAVGPTGDAASLSFSVAGSTTISVSGKNSCGYGTASTYVINVSNGGSVTEKKNINSGAQSVCKGDVTYTYTVPVIANASGYKWYYSKAGSVEQTTGSDIQGGFVTATNSITLSYSPTASSGYLTVRGVSGCAAGDGPFSDAYPVTVNTPPTATISPLAPSVCSESSVVITAAPAGGTKPYASYLWAGTGAVSLSSTTELAPSFKNETGGSYDLTYTVTDSEGCVGIATTTVVVNQAPVANAGPDAIGICTGTLPIQLSEATATGSYSGTPTWSGTGGTWTQSPDPALATFTPSSPSGTATVKLTLTGTNGCSDVYDEREISWNKIPDQPGAFTVSDASVCKAETGVTYTVPADALATSYEWSYTGTNATINGTGNSVTLDFAANATSGTLKVKGVNSCGKSSLSRDISITVNSLPTAPILSEVSKCAGDAPTLSITNGEVGYTYQWSVTTSNYSILPAEVSTATPVLHTPTNDQLFPAGNTDLVSYPDAKVIVTDTNGCQNSVTNASTDVDAKIKIHRIPRTGPPYHVGNNVAK